MPENIGQPTRFFIQDHDRPRQPSMAAPDHAAAMLRHDGGEERGVHDTLVKIRARFGDRRVRHADNLSAYRNVNAFGEQPPAKGRVGFPLGELWRPDASGSA